MAFCSRCGAELEPGSAFCKACGAPVEGAAPQAPEAPQEPGPERAFQAPPPPPPGVPGAAASPPGQAFQAPPPGPTPPQQPPGETAFQAPTYGAPAAPYGPPAAKKGGGKFLLFGILGLLVVGIAVVLVLGFAVGPKWFVGGGEGPEKTVEKFFQAMEKGDAKMMVSLIEPTQLKRLNKQIESYYDSAEELFKEYYHETFPEGDLKITGLQLKSEVKGDLATVTVVAGTATYTDSYGDQVKESVDDPEEVFTNTDFKLKKVEGTWYLMPEFE